MLSFTDQDSNRHVALKCASIIVLLQAPLGYSAVVLVYIKDLRLSDSLLLGSRNRGRGDLVRRASVQLKLHLLPRRLAFLGQ